MAEISAPGRVDPAARTASQTIQNNPNETSISSTFRGVLRGLCQAPNLGRGPKILSSLSGRSQTAAPGGLDHPHRQARPRDEAPGNPGDRDRERAAAPLDPLLCQMAIHLGITPAVGPLGSSIEPFASLPLREDIQNLIVRLARRVAWGGDGRKGSARIELSEGALAGATLIVHAEQRSVSVEFSLPRGATLPEDLQRRIIERLEARGLSARVRVD
jgi:hypothetical protein